MPRGGVRNNLRIIPLGGLEEVGRNMTVFEFGRDIIIVDMGLQFPEEDMPGIDYIIPPHPSFATAVGALLCEPLPEN